MTCILDVVLLTLSLLSLSCLRKKTFPATALFLLLFSTRLFGSLGDVNADPENAARGFAPSPGTLRIPHERNLSLQDFYERFADLKTPVIVEDYSDVFANMTAATIEKSVEKNGSLWHVVPMTTSGPASIGRKREKRSQQSCRTPLLERTLVLLESLTGVFPRNVPSC